MNEESKSPIETSGSESLAAAGSVTPWICTPVDGNGKPLGLRGNPANEFTPVFVRASSRERAERTSRYWLGVFGYRGKFRIAVTHWTPKPDGKYIVCAN